MPDRPTHEPALARLESGLAPVLGGLPRLATALPCKWEIEAVLPVFDFVTGTGVPCSAPEGTEAQPGMGLLWHDPEQGWRPGTVLHVSATGKTVYFCEDHGCSAAATAGPHRRWLQMVHRGPRSLRQLRLSDGMYFHASRMDAPPVILGCRLLLGDVVIAGRDPSEPYWDGIMPLPWCCVVVEGDVRQVDGYPSPGSRQAPQAVGQSIALHPGASQSAPAIRRPVQKRKKSSVPPNKRDKPKIHTKLIDFGTPELEAEWRQHMQWVQHLKLELKTGTITTTSGIRSLSNQINRHHDHAREVLLELGRRGDVGVAALKALYEAGNISEKLSLFGEATHYFPEFAYAHTKQFLATDKTTGGERETLVAWLKTLPSSSTVQPVD